MCHAVVSGILTPRRIPFTTGHSATTRMNYRLLTQLGAGQDGIAYRAEAPADGAAVEVRVLAGARADPLRWPDLVRRLRRAALLTHPGTRRVRELRLDDDPPAVVLEAEESRPLADALRGQLPLRAADAVALAGELADVLAAAHRLGLAHGGLQPARLRVTPAGRLQIDFTGTEGTSGAAESDPAPDPATDVKAVGQLLFWLLTARDQGGEDVEEPTMPGGLSGSVSQVLRLLMATDPAARPSAGEAAERLAAAVEPAPGAGARRMAGTYVPAVDGRAATLEAPHDALLPTPPGRLRIGPGQRLGRYRLLEKLGEGGMGSVYRAEDEADGTVVAVKVLRPDLLQRPDVLRRFHKEARLLAEISNPYVTGLLEVNEDAGVHYIVLEFVAGRPVGDLVAERGRLDEATALAIVADAARGLADAHDRGIVHRDIKPDNLLLVSEPGADGPRVKLSDFGLARHVEETVSLQLTQPGAVLGTPLYMAPEQGTARASVDARADVYSLGATLFHLLAGRPPFEAESPLALIALHAEEPPPRLKQLNSAVSEAACRVVEKCLAKAPGQRYADAAALLRDLERVLRGEPADVVLHPRLPAADPARILTYEWTWHLEASPEQLWPYVSDTDRLNHAMGLPPVQFTTTADPDRGVRRFGRLRRAGLTAAWEEQPFEWVEGRRFGVLREYRQGPFKWFVATVVLEPRLGGGTNLISAVRLEPHGLLGRTAAAVEVGIRGWRGLDRVYRRMDAVLTGKLGKHAVVDPFEAPVALAAGRRRRLEALLDRLTARGLDPNVVQRLGTFLAEAPAQEAARIRPLALARRLAVDPDQLVAACLHGSRDGLLLLLWDILCPVCRVPAQVKDTLKALHEHDHCEACNADFRLDFANSIEMIFRAHPDIRETELGTYCVGGPAHSPHVVAQVRVAPGERLELELALAEGAYRLRGPQLPFALDFRVLPSAGRDRLDLSLARAPGPEVPRVLRAGRQEIVLTNDHPGELLARVERAAPRADALTAARASTLALFRELFPGEVLSPGQLVSVANVTLLVTDLDEASHLYEDLGDAQAFGVIHEAFRLLDERIRREGGALVKTVGEGVVAVFSEPVAAVRAALDLPGVLAQGEGTRGLRLRVGVHRGPALAATLNDHLDYFGSTVNQAARLARLAGGDEVLLSGVVVADAHVAALLQQRGLQGEVVSQDLVGPGLGIVERFRASAAVDLDDSHRPVAARPIP
jgi:serine/threonine protein kinase/class 3 adenylate cyclase